MLKSELDSVTNLFLMFNISSVKFDVSCSITSWPLQSEYNLYGIKSMESTSSGI